MQAHLLILSQSSKIKNRNLLRQLLIKKRLKNNRKRKRKERKIREIRKVKKRRKGIRKKGPTKRKAKRGVRLKTND